MAKWWPPRSSARWSAASVWWLPCLSRPGSRRISLRRRHQEPPPPPPPPPPEEPPPPRPLDPEAAGREARVPAEERAKLSTDETKLWVEKGLVPTYHGVGGGWPSWAKALAHFAVRPKTMA